MTDRQPATGRLKVGVLPGADDMRLSTPKGGQMEMDFQVSYQLGPGDPPELPASDRLRLRDPRRDPPRAGTATAWASGARRAHPARRTTGAGPAVGGARLPCERCKNVSCRISVSRGCFSCRRAMAGARLRAPAVAAGNPSGSGEPDGRSESGVASRNRCWRSGCLRRVRMRVRVAAFAAIALWSVAIVAAQRK